MSDRTHRVHNRAANRLWLGLPIVAGACAFAGCGSVGVSERTEALPPEQACKQLADDLVGAVPKVDQIRLLAESKLSKKTVTVVPLVDLKTGDQSAAMQACDGVLARQFAAAQSLFEVRPFSTDDVAKAGYAVLTASEVATATAGQTNVRLRAALVDAKSSSVLSRVAIVARSEGATRLPTPFFRDSPVLVRDQILESHQATLQPNADKAHPRLMQDLNVRAQLAAPIDMYNRERYPEALREFKSVAATSQGDTLTSHVGVYVAGSRVGSEQDVAASSERIVEKGLEAKQLDFKIFFRPDSVIPYSNPPFDTMRMVVPAANKIGTTRRCLTIVGHTSKTGGAAYNKALSLRRAEFIRDAMVRANPDVRSRITVDGKGFDESIVGNGRDDDTDMADRRVEFRTREC